MNITLSVDKRIAEDAGEELRHGASLSGVRILRSFLSSSRLPAQAVAGRSKGWPIPVSSID
jgi:hypothetical protein